MAASKGSKKNQRGKPRLPLHFYLNGKLHKKLLINRGTDTIITWSYPDEKRVGYTYSDLLKRYEPAFSTQQVCKMVSRSLDVVELAVVKEYIPMPQFSYNIETRNKDRYYWCEKDIMNLHDWLLTRHLGRPRKDGIVIPKSLPSKRELRAIIRNNEILYVKDGDEFVPTWQAAIF